MNPAFSGLLQSAWRRFIVAGPSLDAAPSTTDQTI
jgi:hypothetical protein